MKPEDIFQQDAHGDPVQAQIKEFKIYEAENTDQYLRSENDHNQKDPD